MSALAILMVLLLALVETLAAYISRVYAEFGKILTREIEENLDAWEELIEPQLGLTREHAAICAAVLQQLALGIIALEFGAVLFDRAPHMGRPTYAEIAQAVLSVVLVVVFCDQLLPSLLFNRTQGRWVRRLVWPIRLLLWLMTPITVFIRFFFSVAALAEPPASPAEETAVDVEAL
ncbi:MAG: HlyC/CorC family transporter, partial [Terracidiphilus sp.]